MSHSLRCVGVYRRPIRASLERVRENVFDWEHLPWLHRSTFHAIELRERSACGWRARVGLQPAPAGREIELELRFEPDGLRYVARTLEGSGKGSEIWTTLDPVAANETHVAVEFHLPVLPAQVRAFGAAYSRLYARLWDEDESMIVRRTALLDGVRARHARGSASRSLGSLAELRARLPIVVELAGRPFRVLELDGTLLAHGTVCPHMLGPLDEAPIEHGCVRCPWHGYRFDLRSGANADGLRLRLELPRVEIDPATGEVWLALEASQPRSHSASLRSR